MLQGEEVKRLQPLGRKPGSSRRWRDGSRWLGWIYRGLGGLTEVSPSAAHGPSGYECPHEMASDGQGSREGWKGEVFHVGCNDEDDQCLEKMVKREVMEVKIRWLAVGR